MSGKDIIRELTYRGWSLSMIGQGLGISKQYVWRVVHGHAKTERVRRKIEDILGEKIW